MSSLRAAWARIISIRRHLGGRSPLVLKVTNCLRGIIWPRDDFKTRNKEITLSREGSVDNNRHLLIGRSLVRIWACTSVFSKSRCFFFPLAPLRKSFEKFFNRVTMIQSHYMCSAVRRCLLRLRRSNGRYFIVITRLPKSWMTWWWWLYHFSLWLKRSVAWMEHSSIFLARYPSYIHPKPYTSKFCISTFLQL